MQLLLLICLSTFIPEEPSFDDFPDYYPSEISDEENQDQYDENTKQYPGPKIIWFDM